MTVSKMRRREIIKRVRAEGRKAALEGKHADTNPYPVYDSDRHQWWRGYMEQLDEITANSQVRAEVGK
jgi:ribosome modulation factor